MDLERIMKTYNDESKRLRRINELLLKIEGQHKKYQAGLRKTNRPNIEDYQELYILYTGDTDIEGYDIHHGEKGVWINTEDNLIKKKHGKHQSEHLKGRNKGNKSNTGRIWINNGTKSKMIYPDKLQSWLDKGFQFGRISWKQYKKAA